MTRGRPPSLESSMAELLCELEALTAESVKNELERVRITRILAQMADRASQRSRLVAS